MTDWERGWIAGFLVCFSICMLVILAARLGMTPDIGSAPETVSATEGVDDR